MKNRLVCIIITGSPLMHHSHIITIVLLGPALRIKRFENIVFAIKLFLIVRIVIVRNRSITDTIRCTTISDSFAYGL